MIGHLQTITEACDDIQRWVPARSIPAHEDVYAATEAIRKAALSLAVPGSDGARPSYAALWMAVARLMATRSTCPRLGVGAVIVSEDNRILTTGTNGSPAGLAHCTEAGCLMDDAGHCRRALHAEWNALLQAAQTSQSVKGATLYLTHSPCPTCTVAILNSGIRMVVYGEAYPHPPELADGVAAMVKQSGVLIARFGEDVER